MSKSEIPEGVEEYALNLVPGEELVFGHGNPGDFMAFRLEERWAHLEDGKQRVVRVDVPHEYDGKKALVIQRLESETVHAYTRRVDKYHDHNSGPLDPLDEYEPFTELEWCLVLCEGQLRYAARSMKKTPEAMFGF